MNRSNFLSTKIKLLTRICSTCGKEYQPTGCNQKYCLECRTSARAAHVATRHILHREEDNERSRVWPINHLEESRAIKRRWESKNHGHQVVWDSVHPGANAVRAAIWRINHPGAFARWAREHPSEIRINRLHSSVKRSVLGFHPWNQPFPACEGHHLNPEGDVVYVPKLLHKSVNHNIWTGQNMEQINALALAWLEANKGEENEPDSVRAF
jgi:hypothetical protein